MTAYGPSNKANLTPETPTYAWLAFKFIMYAILLGAPLNYAHRLKKADWVQWSSRHRWTDQQRALDGFLKSLTNEWNLINLTVGVRQLYYFRKVSYQSNRLYANSVLSAAVGLLTVEGLSTISQTAILIALIMALASLVMSVTFVWRYQRQLTNIHDLRKIMDEFIYESDSDIMPIFLSLPVSFLLWSAIAFGTAILSHAWHTFSDAGPVIAVGTTTALGLSILVGTIVWISHRRIGSFKEWWQFGLMGWILKGNVSNRDVGLVHV
ncbi:hypothetical protein AG1IA_02129 [Rhizoctonia solani AG-1 IA]|uniref:Uncharacterized protein n=1 Tax=Thanatephorus cucumeris (strain AG1-IA) TaxID=983506 RepID=L8X0V7_THACA|nr:hypothetical protein AG1IA_02129 [Rhizoctonia solani AG-1 IA]